MFQSNALHYRNVWQPQGDASLGWSPKKCKLICILIFFTTWVGWRIDVMAKTMIFNVMLHFVFPWFNKIWMKYSYFVALKVFGMPTIMKR